jgi:hypothetical protein
VGCGHDVTLNLSLPNSIYKPHLITSGTPTALVQVSGEESATAQDIQRIMAHMCPVNPTWKWEPIDHGANSFLIGTPSAEDLARIHGMQMSVPKVKRKLWSARGDSRI